MPRYVIAEIKITDDSWVPEYAANAHEIVARHGGKYLARSGNITTLEGEPSDASLIAIIEFPNMEAVQAFGEDADYTPYGDARKAGSVSRFVLIDSTDVAGTIPYLEAG